MRAVFIAIMLAMALTTPVSADEQHVVCGKQFVTFVAYTKKSDGVPDPNEIQTFTVRRVEIGMVRFSPTYIPWVSVQNEFHYIPFATARDLTHCLHGQMDDARQALKKKLAVALKGQRALQERLKLERKAHRALAKLLKAAAAERRCD